MFRTAQTRILLSDYEVLQTIHSIWTQRFMTPDLPYCPPLSEKDEDEDEDEDEAEFYQDSLSTSYPRSSSAGYTMSDHERYACDLLKRYRDSKTYFNSSASDSDDLPAYPAGPHTILDTRPVDHSESYQSEGTFPWKTGRAKA
ncbi:hypothetical protein TCE0_034r10800 [Talaromyces pinophilus]|uniref:Uncharacterized protein n=1 Tax=Talaromyces pinophilus TaxID=128442 RepID=A0A6V8HDJ3_TALPI|nr:hypothetical protein TCE0_034r10800 [Talaromyces pinophilus]